MRNILVTGSSGFIGKHLVAYLDSLNFNVHVLLRKHSSTDSKISASINRLYFDKDKTSLKETKEIDCILHLATCYGRADETREEIFDANLKYGLRVLELAKDIKAKYFINFDTSLPSNLNDYSLSKAAFRSAIENLDHSNLNIINLRIETIYGPNKKGTDFSNLIIESCLEGANLIELSNCEQVRDFIFYKDLISCVETILNNLDSFSAFTTLQVGTGVGTSYKKFATLFKYLSNAQTELNFGKLPYRDNEPMKSIADIKDLKKIGWSPVTTLEEGFKEIIAH